MGTIAVHEFVSLDGTYEDPSFTFEFGFDPQMGETLAAITGAAKAILLGRRTFEMFAPAWSTRTVEDDPGAPFFNDTVKYVVGAREPQVEWANSVSLGAYDPDRIRALKDEIDGIVYISGSGTLVRALLADGLVDDLHLFVYPVTLGKGEKLFTEGLDVTKFALKGHDVYANGVVHLDYGPAGS
ncbi:dihydrofolate reductase family protein [Nocardia sp. NPDC004568]|uniref:dihydrofolate reductase family protein n=1 Tax=Nocardia sp. NPDC004568 TaxID=3154551 RepID=UPI0033BDA1AB